LIDTADFLDEQGEIDAPADPQHYMQTMVELVGMVVLVRLVPRLLPLPKAVELGR
jgi:hypothetical protein